jgi:FkbM family methyltransferase
LKKSIINDDIKPRLIGGVLYQQMKGYFKLKKHPDYPFCNNPFIQLLIRGLRLSCKKYFFTSYFIKNELQKYRKNFYDDIYQSLCDTYTAIHDDSIFDFNGVIIPKPKQLEYVFAKETMDILLYYLIDDIGISKIFETLFVEGPYEFGEVRLEHGDVVIDAGANVGLFSALASYKCCSKEGEGEIWSFEPVPQTVSILNTTAAVNNGIKVVPMALSDTESDIDCYLHSVHSGHSIVQGHLKNDVGVIQVQATTLDSFIHKNNIQKINFIKADIEGAERLMLKGARHILRDFGPKLAICSYHLPDDVKVLKELILDANPNYIIEEKYKKLFAYVPGSK